MNTALGAQASGIRSTWTRVSLKQAPPPKIAEGVRRERVGRVAVGRVLRRQRPFGQRRPFPGVSMRRCVTRHRTSPSSLKMRTGFALLQSTRRGVVWVHQQMRTSGRGQFSERRTDGAFACGRDQCERKRRRRRIGLVAVESQPALLRRGASGKRSTLRSAVSAATRPGTESGRPPKGGVAAPLSRSSTPDRLRAGVPARRAAPRARPSDLPSSCKPGAIAGARQRRRRSNAPRRPVRSPAAQGAASSARSRGRCRSPRGTWCRGVSTSAYRAVSVITCRRRR